MRRVLGVLAVVGSLLVAGVLVAVPGEAAGVYKRDAAGVARRIDCRVLETSVAAPSYDAVECRLRRAKVGVFTFRGRGQQAAWLRAVRYYDGFCVATKPGVVVEPDSGRRAVAAVAARRLTNGRVVCG